MSCEINDKVVLITGGANGIGAELLKTFLQGGAKHVAVLDKDVNRGIMLLSELGRKYGRGKVKFIKCDVTNQTELFEAFESVKKDNGYLDVVINNAGVADERIDRIQNEINTNFTAVVNGTIKAVELMRQDQGGKGGTVINISSIAGLCQVFPALFVYMSTKAAVINFTSNIGMQEYHAMTNVRTLTICLGLTHTGMLQTFRSFDPCIDQRLTTEISDMFKLQSTTAAVSGILTAYKDGGSGSVWIVTNDKPAVNISSLYKKSMEAYSEHIFS